MMSLKNGNFLVAALVALGALGSACADDLSLPAEPVTETALAGTLSDCGQQPGKWYAFETWDGVAFDPEVRRAVLIVEHHTMGVDGKAPTSVTIYGVATDDKKLVFAMDVAADQQAAAIAAITRGELDPTSTVDEGASHVLERANHIITLETTAPGPPGPRSPGFPGVVRGNAIVQLALQAAKLNLDLDPICPL
jgi:hypothetical protein